MSVILLLMLITVNYYKYLHTKHDHTYSNDSPNEYVLYWHPMLCIINKILPGTITMQANVFNCLALHCVMDIIYILLWDIIIEYTILLYPIQRMTTLVVYNVTVFCYTVKKRPLDKGEESHLYDDVTHLHIR